MSSNAKRFRMLEETFDLPNIDDSFDNDANDDETPTTEDIVSALESAKDLEKQFKKMNHYDQHDQEMDELAELAIDAHKTLQDLGMNVEIRHAGEIFSSSSQMLKIAVDAKNSKVDKKLKLLKLQLDKMKIDIAAASKSDMPVEGTAVKLDRNELLKQLKEIKDSDK
jgi:hypothetical protein